MSSTDGTIREFDAFPEPAEYGSTAPPKTYTWAGKVGINLTWVAGAFTGIAGEGSTAVVLAGSDRFQAINIRCDYSDFMRMWMAARGQKHE